MAVGRCSSLSRLQRQQLTTPADPHLLLTSLPRQMTAPSPHYVVRDHKRHSLYGTDDRIVLDLGSACWKVGFSGEANPRKVLFARPANGPAPAGIWEVEFEDVARGDGRAARWWQRWETWEGLDVHESAGDNAEPDEEALDAQALREVGEQMVDLRIGDRLRDVFDKCVTTRAPASCFSVEG